MNSCVARQCRFDRLVGKRGDQLALRREAMKIWSDFLLGIEPASNVVPFKKASAGSA
jgi:hypothetical protein